MTTRLPRPPLTPEQRSTRARIAQARRFDPERADLLARDFNVERAEDFIKTLLDQAPPLTAEQREQLAVILRPVSGP